MDENGVVITEVPAGQTEVTDAVTGAPVKSQPTVDPSAIQEQTLGAGKLRTNAEALERFRAMFGETEPEKMQKTELENLISITHDQVKVAGMKRAQTEAKLVALIALYVQRFKVTYTKVAEIVMAQSDQYQNVSAKKRVLQARKGLPSERVQENAPYRQLATRWMRLARWTNQDWNKGEKAVDHVEIMGQTFYTPVDALAAGYSQNAVISAWQWAVKPSIQDLTKLPTRATAAAALANAENITLPIRKFDEKKGTEYRSSVDVVTSISAVFGTVMGALQIAATAGLQFSDEQRDLICDQVERMTVGFVLPGDNIQEHEASAAVGDSIPDREVVQNAVDAVKDALNIGNPGTSPETLTAANDQG